MSLEGLTHLEIIRGISNIFSMILSITLGILMARKYFKYKQIELLIMGLNFIALSALAWGPILAFIMYVFFSVEITDTLYLFLVWGLGHVSIILWMYVFSHLVYPK
ncbi:MAG: hypothetical protein ACFFAH_14655 [Promethearchaeota archaeon]